MGEVPLLLEAPLVQNGMQICIETNGKPMKTFFLVMGMTAVLLSVTTGQCLAQQAAQQPAGNDPAPVASDPNTGAQSTNLDQLAKQLNNPVSSLISVPFQYNFARPYGDDGYQNLLNIQPVIPFSISEDWNLISRTIIPLIQQKDVQPGRTQFGLGDATQSIFFSPKKPTASGMIWGAGPVALLPTGTDGIGANTWGLGPTFVVLVQTGEWTYGILANQIWDTGGAADISSLFLQPFLVKSLGQGRSLALNTESTYDWIHNEWNVPINLSYSKVSRIGHQMVSNQFGIKVFVKTPYGNGPDWGLRYSFTLLFPK